MKYLGFHKWSQEKHILFLILSKIKGKETPYYSAIYSLAVGRWIGIESVMAVTSCNCSGRDLLARSLLSDRSGNDISFYDQNILREHSPYFNLYESKNISEKNLKFITIPGIIGFLSYGNSFLLLFLSCLIFGILSFFLELLFYNFSFGNLFVTALFSEVVAYRLASFGFNPGNTYALFLTIFLNLIIIYVLSRPIKKKLV
jgi:hypothetical protein